MNMTQEKAEAIFNSFAENEWKPDPNYSSIQSSIWKTLEGNEVQAFTRKGKRFIMWTPAGSPDGFPSSTIALD